MTARRLAGAPLSGETIRVASPAGGRTIEDRRQPPGPNPNPPRMLRRPLDPEFPATDPRSSRTTVASAKRSGLAGFLALSVATGVAHAQLPAGNWQYFWGDDFSGTAVDTTKWLTGEPGWANSSQSLANPDGNLATLGGGELTLTAIRDDEGGGYDKSFRGGVITTYPYGSYGIRTPLFTAGSFFEARIKLPGTPGSWPAFWGLDPNAPTQNELDVMEYPLDTAAGNGYANHQYHTAYHYNNYTASGPGQVTTGANLGDGNYRVFSASWVGQKLTYYLDGVPVQSFDNPAVNQMDDLYLILNHAVGGNPDTWIGRPNLAEWPVGHTDEMVVDWVRVWKLADAGTTSWTNASGLSGDWLPWEAGASWSNGSPNLGGVTANFGTLGGLSERRIDIVQGGDGNRTLSVINFDGGTRYRIGWPNDRMVLGFGNNGAIQPTINVAATTTTDHELWTGLEWSGTLNINNSSAHPLLLTGPVRGGDGIQINGPGVVSFDSSDNSYSGTTVIDAGSPGPGVARARGRNSLGSGLVLIGPVGNATTARLELENDALVPNPVALPGRNNDSAGIVSTSGTNVISGTVRAEVGGGNYWIRSDAGHLELSGSHGGGVALRSNAGGTRTFTLRGGGDGTVSGAIENGNATVNLAKADGGTWSLEGTNTYTGTTTVDGGVLEVLGTTGTGAVTVNGGGVLQGRGTVRSSLTAQPGATVRAGETGFPLLPPASLIDDFEAYPVGGIGATPNATGDAWIGVFNGTANARIADIAGDRALEVNGINAGSNGWRGAIAELGSRRLPHGQTGTYFFRVRSADTGACDYIFGLTDQPVSTAAAGTTGTNDWDSPWNEYAVTLSIAGGNLRAYGEGSGDVPVAPIASNTWLNVWVVVDHAAKTFRVATSGGAGDGNLYAATFPFGRRSAATVGTNPLITFGAYERNNVPGQLDDLHFTPGTDLSQPAAEPVPTAATLDVAGSFTLSAGATLELDVSTGALHDRVDVAGTFTAHGTLKVTLDPSRPSPRLGDRFDLFDAGSSVVAFEDLVLPPLTPGLDWDTVALGTGVLEVVADPTVYEGWALGHPFPPGTDDPSLDPDGDGLANCLEWLFGSDPLAADPSPLPDGGLVAVDGSEFAGADPSKRYLRMTATIRKAISGMTLTGQGAPSPTLLDAPGAADAVASRALVDLGDFEEREWFYTVPVDESDTGFLRLQLSEE